MGIALERVPASARVGRIFTTKTKRRGRWRGRREVRAWPTAFVGGDDDVGGDFRERDGVRRLCRLLHRVAVRFMSGVSGSSAKEN